MMIDAGDVFCALQEGQRQALGYLAVRVFLTGWSFALLLFSGFCALIGLLILRSRFIPRIIGALMIVAGASYFANSLAAIVAPRLSESLLPWILMPCFVGELLLGVWLLVKGIRTNAPEVA